MKIHHTKNKNTTRSRVFSLVIVTIVSGMLLGQSILQVVSEDLGITIEDPTQHVVRNILQSAIAESAILSSTENDLSTNPPSPQIALDSGTSNVYVVWQAYNASSGMNEVFFAEKESIATEFEITDPLATTENAIEVPPKPQIAVDSTTGNVYLVWQGLNSSSSSMDIIFAERQGGSTEFSIGIGDNNDALNPFSNDGSDKYPTIAVDSVTGSIFIVWIESGEIIVANSTNAGIDFDVTTAITSDELYGNPTNVQIAIGDSGNAIYLVWQDQTAETELSDIYVSRSTDGGASYSSPTNLSQTEEESGLPALFASENGQTITIAWQELVTPLFDDNSTPTYDIYTIQSSDAGDTFGDAENFSNTEGLDSINPSIGSSPDKTKMFLAWEELSFVTLTSNFFVSFSDDGGASLACPTKVGSTTDFSGGNLQIVGDDLNSAYAVWEEVNATTFSTNDIIFFDNLDYQAPYVTLELDSANEDSDFDGIVESKWGIQSQNVTVSGRFANADPGNGDFVSVDWGDGVNTDDTTISLSSCSWEAVSHVYDQASAGFGIVQISASLLDGGTSEPLTTVETPLSVAVRSHTTELVLNPIPSVPSGNDTIASGLLRDLDTGEGIPGMTIFLDGSGTDFGLSSESPVTDAGGIFSLSAATSPDAGNEWVVQAHFGGDTGYEFSDSEIQYYDTVGPGTTEIDVTETGSNVEVILEDLDATVTFEDVESLLDGKLYVSECSPIDTSRFAALTGDNQGTCLVISPGIQMAAGSEATLKFSYNNATIPDGYTETDLDIFHAITADQSTFVDITQSRNITANTVTGVTSFFGMFVAGAAIHSDPTSSNALRQQIFVGDDNTVEFRDVDDPTNSTAVISLDKSSYRLTETATLTINDNANANLQPNVADTVSAGVWSTTSGEDGGITITLIETGVDSGVFKGTFTFKNSGSSSGTTLRVSTNDKLTVTYEEPSGGRLKATFDGVVESGLVEMSDFEVLTDSTPFSPVGYAVNMKLIDAQLDTESGLVSVTLSYANADLAESDERYLRLFQAEDLGDGTANWSSEPISTSDEDGFTIGLDSDAKTITATTTTAQGVFLLGYDIGSPGGAGGGIGHPGSGLVVDLVASIALQASRGGGGVGAGDSLVSSEISSGDSVESSFDIEGSQQNLEVLFSGVDAGGIVTVEQLDPSDISSLFNTIKSDDSLSLSKGTVTVDGSSSTTIGNVFDIETPASMHYDNVQVTIPYDESLVLALGSTEEDVRFLHYDGDSWEDRTIAIDTESNTVTGIVSSLSPIVAAVIEDGTFGELYLESHPLAVISIRDASYNLSPRVGEQEEILDHDLPNTPFRTAIEQDLGIGATLVNLKRGMQPFSFIVQIYDDKGTVVAINWVVGELSRGESREVVSKWTPNIAGSYTATILVLEGDPDKTRLLGILAPKIGLAGSLVVEAGIDGGGKGVGGSG